VLILGLNSAAMKIATKARMCEGTKKHQGVYYKEILGVFVATFSLSPGENQPLRPHEELP
jgi:hypothetical protein